MAKTTPWWADRVLSDSVGPQVQDLTGESIRLDALFEKACSDIKDFLEFDFVAIQLVRPASRYIETVHGVGAARNWAERAKHYIEPDPSLRDIQADVVQTGLTEIIVGSDSRFDRWIFNEYKHVNYSRIFIPLVVRINEYGEPITDSVKDINFKVSIESSSGEGRRTALMMDPDSGLPEFEIIGTIEAGYCHSEREVSVEEAVSLFALVSELAVKIYKLLLPYGLKRIAEKIKSSVHAHSVCIDFLYDQHTKEFVYHSASRSLPSYQTISPQRLIQYTHELRSKTEEKASDNQQRFKVLEEDNQTFVVFPFSVHRLQVNDAEQLLVGCISLRFTDKEKLCTEVLSLMELFPGRLADVLWNLVTYLKMREQTRQLRILHSVSISLSQMSENGDLLNHIAWSTLNILAADVITIYEYVKSENNFLTPPSVAGRLKVERQMMTELSGDDIPHRLINYGMNKYVSNDSRQDDLFQSGERNSFVNRESIASTAGILLKVGEEIVGTLFINYRNHHYFDKNDKQIINTLAAAAAVAIKNQRWLDTIDEVDKDIILTLEQEELLAKIVQKAVLVTAASLGNIRLLDIGNQELVMKARFPKDSKIDERWNRTSIKDGGEGITGWVAHNKKSRIVHNVSEEGVTYKPFFADAKSELCVPLLDRDRSLLGVLNVESSQANDFDGRDQRRLESLADLVVVALQNVQTNEQRAAIERVATLNHTARSIFHRMNNHLGAANVWAKKIADGSPNAVELANKIRREITQALADRKRIRNWLTDLQPVDVKQSIYSALSRINIPSNIKTELTLGDVSLPKILCIQGQLEDSFFNIIKNSVDAMPKGGLLTINSVEIETNAQKWLIVQVVDSGLGIPRDIQRKIFMAQYTTKDGHDGDGLWLTKTYIDNIGGQITVESTLHEGTKATLLLPSVQS